MPVTPYHVLLYSRHYGTCSVACDALLEAARTLARLAETAERQRQQDGQQRYFCLLAPEALPLHEAEPAPVPENTLVLCVENGSVRWASSNLGSLLVLLLDLDRIQAGEVPLCQRLPLGPLPPEFAPAVRAFAAQLPQSVSPRETACDPILGEGGAA